VAVLNGLAQSRHTDKNAKMRLVNLPGFGAEAKDDSRFLEKK
jgi:hypothetical protein